MGMMRMNQEFTSNKARTIKANHLLRNKVGVGEIEESAVLNMQRIMDTTTTDFVPMGLKLLEDLSIALDNAKRRNGDEKLLIEGMTEPVMQIKANAAMFHYELVSTLADLVLNFLENINSLDEDVLEIVHAHQQSLSLILNNQISGTGGETGAALEKELQDACRRYFTKKGRNLPTGTEFQIFEKL